MKYLKLLLLSLLFSGSALAVAPITGVTHLCVSGTTTLSDATAGGVWNSSNASIASIDMILGDVYGVSAGIATITYTVGSGYAITNVTVNPVPSFFLVSGGGSYCAGSGGVHVGLVGSQSGVNYLLYIGTSPTGPYTGTGSALDFGLETTPGSYTVVATTMSTGCSSIMPGSATITITPSVVPTVSIFTGFGDTVCAGSSTTFTAVDSNGGSSPDYEWTVNGVVVGGDSANYTFVPADGDMVRVRLISDEPCASPDTVTDAHIIHVLTPVMPAVSISAIPGNRVCMGDAVLLNAVPVYGGSAPAYTWTKNGAYASTGSSYTTIPVNGDTIHCIMVSNYRCVLEDTAISPKLTVIVDSPVTPYVTIVANPSATIGFGVSDTLKAVVINGGAFPTYQWVLNNTIIPGATNDTYVSDTFSSSFPDSVTCVVTGSGACYIISYTWIYIVVSEAGINPLTNNRQEPIIWPNPAQNELFIEHAMGTAFSLYDMMGRAVLESKLSGQKDKERMDISCLPKGVYLAQFVDPSTGARITKRVVKD